MAAEEPTALTAAQVIATLKVARPAEIDTIRGLLQIGDMYRRQELDTTTGKAKAPR